jgi:glycine/D-amino acid oxidase-like deaminating enzyme/nitrite reductase/ring-hydroxylating ferredoxin subunit
MEQPLAQEQPLLTDEKTDVLVIGGGIAGLSTAYELMRQGVDVMVIDRGTIAGGMSARTSAHLSFELDDYYHELISLRGEENARTYFESQRAAIARIEEIVERERIDCDFARVDLFLFAPDRSGRKTLEKEIEAAQRVGVPGVDWAEAPVAGDVEGCLRFPDQARFHPLKYLKAVAEVLKASGVRIYAHSPVLSVEETDGRVIATTEQGVTVRANAAVLATNTPFVDPVAIHTKQAPYRTYVIAATIAQGHAPDALIWDTLDPYHYVRLQRHGPDTLLIIGGEDHKTGTHNDARRRLTRLERWARARFPNLGEVRYAWSGQVYESVDYVPFIGRNPGHERIFVVTGDSGSGLTMGVAASLILPDLIAGRENPWVELYDPSRKPHSLSAVSTFIKENVSAAGHIAEHLLPSSGSTRVRRDTGSVLTSIGGKHALYRDKSGELHKMSASCTHLGCVVQWNSFECCWDCPCHGSHFSATGEVLQGPAVKGLKPVSD